MRSTALDRLMDAVPDEQSREIVHRKKFVDGYLYRVCADPSQMELWGHLDKRSAWCTRASGAPIRCT